MSAMSARDFNIGDAPIERVLDPITRTGIVRYGGASGDFNRVHHDEPFAISKGYPGVFAMGLYPAGVLATMVTDWLGLAGLRFFSVRFKAQVWPDEVIHFSASVTDKRDYEDKIRVDFSALATSATGEVKVEGRGFVVLDV